MTKYTHGIDHIGITSQDLEKSVDFFVTCLKWEVFGENKEYPAKYVTDGYGKVTIWEAQTDNPKSFNRYENIGLHHLAIRVETEYKLRELYNQVKDWPDVTTEFAPGYSDAGPKIHFMIYEPGGNRLEFTFDPRLV